MKTHFCEVYYDVEKAVDKAFSGHFILSFYDYLKSKDAKKIEVEEFLKSQTVDNIHSTILDLDEYLEGGADNMHKQLREAYGHIPKPQARKIRNYLSNILQDAHRYNDDKRPGRKRKKNKTK